MLSWLREKTLAALTSAAQLVDLANEPDTTEWYAKRLRGSATELIARLAPVVAYLHGAKEEALAHESWEPIVQDGSLGLARWSWRHGIAAPGVVGAGALVDDEDWEPEERAEKAAVDPRAPAPADGPGGDAIKLELYGALAGRLLHGGLAEASARLLVYLLWRLRTSPYADAVHVSRRFLPSDTGLAADAVAEAYRDLYDRGLVETAPDPEETDPGSRHETPIKEPMRESVAEPDRLLWRLVAEGVNEGRERPPFQAVVFGYPGATIAGQRTLPGRVLVEASAPGAAAALAWWGTAGGLAELAGHLQATLGAERVHIDAVGAEGGREIEVRLRHPIDADEEALRRDVKAAVTGWLREKAGTAPS